MVLIRFDLSEELMFKVRYIFVLFSFIILSKYLLLNEQPLADNPPPINIELGAVNKVEIGVREFKNIDSQLKSKLLTHPQNSIQIETLNNSNSQAGTSNLISATYLDRDSEEYEKALLKYKDEKDTFMIGDFVYIPIKSETKLDFVKTTIDELKEPRNDFYNIYKRLLEELNSNGEGYGEWSYSSEYQARKIFESYYGSSNYNINAMACREKRCIIEFEYLSMEEAITFISNVRSNSNGCSCKLIERFSNEINIAVLEIVFV